MSRAVFAFFGPLSGTPKEHDVSHRPEKVGPSCLRHFNGTCRGGVSVVVVGLGDPPRHCCEARQSRISPGYNQGLVGKQKHKLCLDPAKTCLVQQMTQDRSLECAGERPRMNLSAATSNHLPILRSNARTPLEFELKQTDPHQTDARHRGRDPLASTYEFVCQRLKLTADFLLFHSLRNQPDTTVPHQWYFYSRPTKHISKGEVFCNFALWLGANTRRWTWVNSAPTSVSFMPFGLVTPTHALPGLESGQALELGQSAVSCGPVLSSSTPLVARNTGFLVKRDSGGPFSSPPVPVWPATHSVKCRGDTQTGDDSNQQEKSPRCRVIHTRLLFMCLTLESNFGPLWRNNSLTPQALHNFVDDLSSSRVRTEPVLADSNTAMSSLNNSATGRGKQGDH